MQQLVYKLEVVTKLQRHEVPHSAIQNEALRLGSPLLWQLTMDYVTEISIQFMHNCNN